MNNIKKNKITNKLSLILIFLNIIVVIIMIVSLISNNNSWISIIVCICIEAICIYLCINEMIKKNTRVSDICDALNSNFSSNLNLLGVPIAIVKKPNRILWKNKAASHILTETSIIDSALGIVNKDENKTNDYIINNGNKYEIIGNVINIDGEEAILVAYMDKTEENKLKQILDDTKVAVGVAILDNYDETMQGIDEIKKAEITANITKVLADFASENKGVIAKADKDKYILFVETKYVKKMEEEAFEILQKIRNVTKDTKIAVTMSIGMSYIEPTLDERYKSASAALDIALGRGGDQSVVKRDKKFDFYGGKDIGIEKTSRVRARAISQAVKETIEKSDVVYIIGHKNTDIDCIGAAVGIAKIAKSYGKEVYIIIDTKLNASTKAVINKVKETNEYDNVFIAKDEFKKVNGNSILFVVDTHKKSYLAYPDILDEFEKVIVIDHHRRGTEFIENAFLTYHEIYSSSTCELVTEILMYLDNIELTPEESECIYAGIVIDTKNFMFKTGVRTFEVAAYLKKFGIDLTNVKQVFQNDFETYIAKVNIVKNAEVIKGKIAISVADEEYHEMPIIAAQAADELLSISGIVASFVLCKVDNVIMISGRSMGDINVQAVLEKIGGGGHLTFAGAQIAGITLEEAKEKLLIAIDSCLN